MRIQARKCPFTGAIFEEKDRKKYIKHPRTLRKNMRAAREKENLKNTWKEWLLVEKLKITRPEQIPEWFLKNQKKIMDACNAVDGAHRWFNSEFVPADEFTRLEFSGMNFSRYVSNSHSCPEGGMLNWSGDADKPKGYIGWTTYVTGTLNRPIKHDSEYPYSGALRLIGLHTGSGGGGNKNFGYDLKIFLDDWPGLKAAVIRINRLEAVTRVKRERDEIVRRLRSAR